MKEVIDFGRFIAEGIQEHTPTDVLVGAISDIVKHIQYSSRKIKREVDTNERSYIDGLCILEDYAKDHTVSPIDWKALSFYMSVLYGNQNSNDWNGEKYFFERYGNFYYEIYETATSFLFEQISSEYVKYEITRIEQNCHTFLEQEYKKSSDFYQKSFIKSLIHLLPYVTKRLKTLFFI